MGAREPGHRLHDSGDVAQLVDDGELPFSDVEAHVGDHLADHLHRCSSIAEPDAAECLGEYRNVGELTVVERGTADRA